MAWILSLIFWVTWELESSDWVLIGGGVEDWPCLTSWQVSSDCACLKLSLLDTAQCLMIWEHVTIRGVGWLPAKPSAQRVLRWVAGKRAAQVVKTAKRPHLPWDNISSDFPQQTFLYPSCWKRKPDFLLKCTLLGPKESAVFIGVCMVGANMVLSDLPLIFRWRNGGPENLSDVPMIETGLEPRLLHFWLSALTLQS